jgi:hypothetical protein
MSPTLQNTRAQRNATLARSSSITGYVRYWHKADDPTAPAFVRFRTSGHRINMPLLTQSGHSQPLHGARLSRYTVARFSRVQT